MDLLTILIFLGFVLCGLIMGLPLGFKLGKNAAYNQIVADCDEIPEDVLEAEFIGGK